MDNHPDCPRRVYPRVCGGTNVDGHRLRLLKGLSPRVRGNPGWTITRIARDGSIPACAGEPSRLPAAVAD